VRIVELSIKPEHSNAERFSFEDIRRVWQKKYSPHNTGSKVNDSYAVATVGIVVET
jgi:hypothetical protein